MSAIPQGLIDAVASRRIVPFVGAGLSVTLGPDIFPTWPELIERLAVRLQKEGSEPEAVAVRAAAAAGNLVDAAERVVTHLSKRFFLDEMRSAFNRRLPHDADLTTVGAVWRMLPRLVITTNFEHVLEWPLNLPDAVPYQQPSLPPVIVHNDDSALLQEIDDPPDEQPRIWHLHGSVDRPDTIILTTRQFKRLYGKRAEYKLAQDRLRNLLVTRPLLFVGFSLSDPYVRRQIADVVALTERNSPVSYLVVKRGQKILPGLRHDHIQLVEFDDFGAPMTELLNAIASAARPELANADDTAVPPHLVPVVRKLRDTLAGLYPKPAVVAAAYNRSRPEGWANFPDLGDGVFLLRCAIERLALAPVQRGSGGGWPLLTFAARLRESAPAHKDALDQWMNFAIDEVGASDAERERIRRSLTRADRVESGANPYVLVRILEADPQRWSVQAWLFEKGPASVPASLFEDERGYAPSRCSDLVRDLVFELLGKRFALADTVIAFLLPRKLLWEQVEGWRPMPEPSLEPALGTSAAVTVRPQRDALELRYVRRFWDALCEDADRDLELVDFAQLAATGRGKAVWLSAGDPAVSATVRKLRESGVTCAVIAVPRAPGTDPSTMFEVVLAAGVPVVLWLRDGVAADSAGLRADVAQLIGAPVLDLPSRLRGLRAKEDDQGVAGLGSRLGLIWDAAEYLPPDSDPDNRAMI